MTEIILQPTILKDAFLLQLEVFGDDRGFFIETYREDWFSKMGVKARFVQDNHSGSRQGTLRGLHYQIRQPQGKLVRVIAGEIFDVAVDLRRSSPTFGKWVGVSLSAQNKTQLWVPPGFAHGFYVVSDWAEVVYKATDYYAPEWERRLLWCDPQIGIKWPIIPGKDPLLSTKDSQGLALSQAETYP